jgi:hypothetical protein
MIAPSYTDIVEKRKHCRYNLPLKVLINKKKEGDERQCNISMGGVSFLSPIPLKENDFILFHFSGKENTDFDSIKFSILGRIIWLDKNSDDTYKYGAQFKFYDDPFSSQQHSIMTSAINQFAA